MVLQHLQYSKAQTFLDANQQQRPVAYESKNCADSTTYFS